MMTVALEIPSQVRHRQAFLLQRRLELLFGLELVFLLDVVDDALELLVAQLVAQLLAALHDEHLVHALTMICGVTSSSASSKLLVAGVAS